MSEPWNLPEREATPEKDAVSRRRWLRGTALGVLALGGGLAAWWHWFRPGSDHEVLASGDFALPGQDLYPAAPNGQRLGFFHQVSVARHLGGFKKQRGIGRRILRTVPGNGLDVTCVSDNGRVFLQ